jgi:hypothetical protein
MSTHRIPREVYTMSATEIETQVRQYDDNVIFDGNDIILAFYPDLTPSEQATLDRIIRWARTRTKTSLDSHLAIETDLANLKSFLALNNPNTSQTANALKSAIRVVAFFMNETV